MSSENCEIFKFEKSYNTRFDEFNEIFWYDELKIGPSTIAEMWASYLETVLEPVGWTALWKVPMKIRREDYSDAVLFVMVDNVDFQSLTASVTILEKIGTAQTFPCDPFLKDLFPTVFQENASLSIKKTAETIDQLRIFYEYIYRPWDIITEASTKPELINWKSIYLEMRLRLYYDYLRKPLEYSVANHIWALQLKGYKLFLKAHDYCQMVASPPVSPIPPITEEIKPIKIMKSEKELLGLLVNISRYESCWRKNTKKLFSEKYTVIVMPTPTKLSEYIEHIREVDRYTTCEHWDFNHDIPKHASTNQMNVIIATAESYYPDDMSCITQGGTIMGLPGKSRPTISDEQCDGTYLCDLYGSKATFSDLIFSVSKCKELIAIHSGSRLEMNRVQMQCIDMSDDIRRVAIIVHNDAKLTAEQCSFIGFNVAIVAFPGSTVKLDRCQFENIQIGIQAFDGSKVDLNDVDESIVQSASNKYLKALLNNIRFTTHYYCH